MIEAVIFDMDGLLIESEPIYKQAWQAEAKALGYTIEDAQYETLIGLPTADCEKKLVSWFDDKFPMKQFRSGWQSRRKKILDEQGIGIKQGAIEIIHWLKNNKIHLGLATSSSMAEVLENKNFVPELSNFEVILTSDHISRGKPDPLIYLTACEKLKSEAESTVIFEDSNLGIESAIRSGCKAIMIPDLKAPNQFALDNAFKIYDSLNIALENRNEWL